MADMKPRIEAILTGTPFAVTKVAHLWQIRVGQHAGARENGVSLAHDLLAKYRKDPSPAPVQSPPPPAQAGPAIRVDPNRLQQTEANLVATLDKLEARERTMPAPPPQIADLLRVHETYEQTNARLVPMYAEAKNMAERAIDAGDKPERMRWEAKAERIETAIHWNRGRKIETL